MYKGFIVKLTHNFAFDMENQEKQVVWYDESEDKDEWEHFVAPTFEGEIKDAELLEIYKNGCIQPNPNGGKGWVITEKGMDKYLFDTLVFESES
jgi:hypothetical protein